MNFLNIIILFASFFSYVKSDCFTAKFFNLRTKYEPILYNYSTDSIVNYIYPQPYLCYKDEPYYIGNVHTHVACPGSYIDIPNEKNIFKCTTSYVTSNAMFVTPSINLKNCNVTLSTKGPKCHKEVIPKMLHVKNFFGKRYSIGYQINAIDFLKIYDIVRPRDESIRAKTRISRFVVDKPLNSDDHLEDIDYKEGLIYKEEKIDDFGINLTEIYSRSYQIKRFMELLNDDVLVDKYFSDDNSLIASQLISKDDMYYRSQKLSTFFYENTTPMWRSINEGNWKLIGELVRRIIDVTKRDLNIFVYPLDKLKINGSHPVDLQDKLQLENLLKIPQVIAKVVVDPLNKSRGIVFHTFNDPYIDKEVAKDLFSKKLGLCVKLLDCTDEYPEFLNVKNGLTFCCSLEDSGVWEIVKDD